MYEEDFHVLYHTSAFAYIKHRCTVDAVKRHGKAAGYLRNTEMAKNADALVAFWDGMSLGTRHMIETAKAHGLNVRVKRYDKESGVR